MNESKRIIMYFSFFFLNEIPYSPYLSLKYHKHKHATQHIDNDDVSDYHNFVGRHCCCWHTERHHIALLLLLTFKFRRFCCCLYLCMIITFSAFFNLLIRLWAPVRQQCCKFWVKWKNQRNKSCSMSLTLK